MFYRWSRTMENPIREGYWVVRQKGRDDADLQIAYVGYPFHSSHAMLARFGSDGQQPVDRFELIDFVCTRDGLRDFLKRVREYSNG